MSSKKETERLEKLEAEEAALDQRIERLETQIREHQEQGRLAYRAKNMRRAKQEQRFLIVLNKQLDQLSAMKINIFECLQSEAMRGFVTNYAEAIKPVAGTGALSIEKAEANIHGTMDFMDRIGELTDVVTEEMGGGDSICFESELEQLFGGDDNSGGARHDDKVVQEQADGNISLPDVPIGGALLGRRSPTPPPEQPESVAKLETTLSLVSL